MTSRAAWAERHLRYTFNDPALTSRMEPTLRRVSGDKVVPDLEPRTVAEDFSVFQQKVPGLYFFVVVVSLVAFLPIEERQA